MDYNLDKVFKSYDIRGVAYKDFDEEFFYLLGKAFVTFLNAKKVAVGYDIRKESKDFFQFFVDGCIDSGVNVVNLGEIPSEMISFVSATDTSFDGVVSITASHNPAGYTGAKMVSRNCNPLSSIWGLKEIKDIIKAKSFKSSKIKGNLLSFDFFPIYKDYILSFLFDKIPASFKSNIFEKFNIVVDAGNGIGGIVFDYIFKDLNLNVEKLFFEPDGTFPNHEADPFKQENIQYLCDRVLASRSDLGIAFDGDSDRVFFVDRKGRAIPGIFIASILTKYFLNKYSKVTVVHDTRAFWPLVKEFENDLNIKFVMSKVGHSIIKNVMKQNNAIFGAELSSHFYYKDFFFADSAMLTLALIFKLILFEKLDLTSVVDNFYEKYFLSGEVNYIVEESLDNIVDRIKGKFSDCKFDYLDGISAEFSDFRFNIRKSNTEPLVRLNVESLDKKVLVDVFDCLDKLIGGTRKNKPMIKFF